jgi:hypothetical protein
MSAFGWSYPPGCSGPPDDGPCICEVCNGDVDRDECICPECPTCGTHGDPDCYADRGDAGHWLIRTPEQIAQHDRKEKEWADACKAEADALAAIHQQHEEGIGYP